MQSPTDAPSSKDLPLQLESLIRRLRPLPEITMRQAVLEETLRKLLPTEACWFISQFIRGALRGKAPHDDATLASMLWLQKLQRNNDYDTVKSYFTAAYQDNAHELLYLFREPPPHRTLASGARLPEVRLPLGREITLGERRSLASGSNKRILERLLMDPNVLVLGKLLLNPHLQPRDIVTVASRRPTNPLLLAEITKHPRWMIHHQVREALTLNPFIHTGLALKLLPTLEYPFITRIALANDLHPMIPEFATLLRRLHANASTKPHPHTRSPDTDRHPDASQ